MPDFIIFFSLEMAASMLVALVMGILLLVKKSVSDKARKDFGIILLAVALFNLLFFNVFMRQSFSFDLWSLLALVLFFAITFIEGFAFIMITEIKKGVKNIFGMLLVFLFIFWVASIIITV